MKFFDYLKEFDLKDIKIFGFNNGDVIIPNEPLLKLEGPLAKVQILETTLLNLCNYPTLISTLSNKLKNKFKNIILIEDGINYAQSGLGGLLGSKYGFIGGVDCI